MTWSLSPQFMPRSLRWCVQEVVGRSPQLEESGGVRKAPWLAQRGLRERAYPSRCSVRASGRLQTRSPVSGSPLWLNLSQPSVVLASMVLGPSSFLHMSCICRFHTSKAPRWPQVWGRAFNTAPLNVFSPSGISEWGGRVGWHRGTGSAPRPPVLSGSGVVLHYLAGMLELLNTAQEAALGY